MVVICQLVPGQDIDPMYNISFIGWHCFTENATGLDEISLFFIENNGEISLKNCQK